MIHLYEDYYTESDGVNNIVLYKKGVVAEKPKKGSKAKAENVGKVRYEAIGYYPTITGLIDGLSRKVMIDILADRRIRDLKDAVDRLNSVVDSLDFTIKVNGEEKRITAKLVAKE